jgi:hypothetical protein
MMMREEVQSIDKPLEREVPLSSILKSPSRSLLHGLVVEGIAYLLLVLLALIVDVFWVSNALPPETSIIQIPFYFLTSLGIGCILGFVNQTVSINIWNFRGKYSRQALCAQGIVLLIFSAFLLTGFLRISIAVVEWASIKGPVDSLAAILIIILTSPIYTYTAINVVSWDVHLYDKRGRSEVFRTTAKCPYCDAVYAYKEEDVREGGEVYCQNCTKGFRFSISISSDENE